MIDRETFRTLVAQALDSLPDEFRARLENVEVVVEEEPTTEQLVGVGLDPGRDTLFGLYEGTPLPDRGFAHGMTLPDRVTIFYRPLVESFLRPHVIRREIRHTVIHEIAHFFGMDEEEIEDLGY